MGFLDDIMAQDAAFTVDPDVMPGTEPIVYLPAGETTRKVTGNAVVYRMQLKPLGGVPGGGLAPSLQVFVPRSFAPDPQPGDVFLIATQYGGTPEPHPFARRLQEDAGGYLLELR